MTKRLVLALMAATMMQSSHASEAQSGPTSPLAPMRTHAENYKDMVLATCLATAYRNEPAAAKDLGSSVSALRDWTYFDLDESPLEIRKIVDDYLAADYRNPLVEAEVKDVKFDFLKCIDLYHSAALAAQVKRLVIKPKQIEHRDHNPQK